MTDPSTSITTTTKKKAACLRYLDANTINIRSVCENNEQHYRKQHKTPLKQRNSTCNFILKEEGKK